MSECEEQQVGSQNIHDDDSQSKCTKESDLSDTSRNIHIVTTAALPWMTGTAVNPLLRALYLQKSRTNNAKITLMIPWVENEQERKTVYGHNDVFSQGKAGRKEQEAFVRKWAEEKAGMVEESQTLRIQFYVARYLEKMGSIVPLVDLCCLIPAQQADIAILEEPEHLNWLALPAFQRPGDKRRDDFLPTTDFGWTQKFNHVVGIVHTNYPEYVRSYGVRGSRRLSAKTIHGLNVLVCRAYCHRLIKLSATLPVLAKYKETICNVHGVRGDFLSDVTSHELVEDPNAARVYFIGKVLWAKGFDFLLKCQYKYRQSTGEYFPIGM
jgi:digalactosyldiacylglycerol synthase